LITGRAARLPAAADLNLPTVRASCPIAGTVEFEASAVRKVVFCSGKIYYDLIAERERRGVGDIAFIRIERLYPLPATELQAALAPYTKAQKFVWAQDEPANQGAWPFIALNLIDHLDLVLGAAPDNADRLRRVSRPASSSPAVGSAKRHQQQQEELINEVFEI